MEFEELLQDLNEKQKLLELQLQKPQQMLAEEKFY